jgi:hypothetical protein
VCLTPHCPAQFHHQFDRVAEIRECRQERHQTRKVGAEWQFRSTSFTPDSHPHALKQLEAAGAGAPKGRTLHVALDIGGEISVFDIWESQEEFDAFGATLVPILSGLGIELSEPMVAPVHNVIEG